MEKKITGKTSVGMNEGKLGKHADGNVNEVVWTQEKAKSNRGE